MSLKEDHHVHLYGCLTAEDLWLLGKENYKNRKAVLDWYAKEYALAWGRVINPESYWTKENGFELLKLDYLFNKPASFKCFQANFNLIIALCPLSPVDFSIPKKIIEKTAQSDLEYFEARTLFPFHYKASEAFSYLKGLCQTVKDCNKNLALNTKLVFSLFRENSLALKHYGWIREFFSSYPDLAEEIVGIDFAFAEESFPPAQKKKLFEKFHQDNLSGKKLKLLYHVGESFEDKSQISAIRWIYESWKLGATRLGHACALGVNPENLKGKVIEETQSEYLSTLLWLLKNFENFKEFGLQISKDDLLKRRKLATTKQKIRVEYTDELIAETRNVQVTLAKVLRKDKLVIESCPSSNLYIGQLKNKSYHPLKFFNELELNYVLGTDDPGVFDTDWKKEYFLAKDLL